MYYRILGGKLIQLSDNFTDGYKQVIEQDMPQEQDGYYITHDYQIIDNEVHKIYKLVEEIRDDYTN